MLDSQAKAFKIAELLYEKKANDVLIMELKGISIVADYFVIASGNSNTQVQALSDYVLEKMTESGCEELRVEGKREAHWVLIDYGDVVVHIFQQEDREFYNLERLWGDAKMIKYEELEK